MSKLETSCRSSHPLEATLKSLTALLALVAFAAPNVMAQCGQPYGCQAELRAAPISGSEIRGMTRFPTTWYANEPPASMVIIWKNGQEVQRVPIDWAQQEYLHTCPSEWIGYFTVVPNFEYEPGDLLEVIVGTWDLCWSEVERLSLLTEGVGRQRSAQKQHR